MQCCIGAIEQLLGEEAPALVDAIPQDNLVHLPEGQTREVPSPHGHFVVKKDANLLKALTWINRTNDRRATS